MKTKLNWTKGVGKNAQGQVGVLETQRANYTDKATRDEHAARLKAAGARHVIKFTTHDAPDPKIIYVVTWAEPAPLTIAQEANAKRVVPRFRDRE
jgi:hypothetical protein